MVPYVSERTDTDADVCGQDRALEADTVVRRISLEELSAERSRHSRCDVTQTVAASAAGRLGPEPRLHLITASHPWWPPSTLVVAPPAARCLIVLSSATSASGGRRRHLWCLHPPLGASLIALGLRRRPSTR